MTLYHKSIVSHTKFNADELYVPQRHLITISILPLPLIINDKFMTQFAFF